MSERNTYSEAPINITEKKERDLTFPDVAMRFVQDVPIYMVITIVGILAIKGVAETKEFIIAGMGMMLSKSWPKAIAFGGKHNHLNGWVAAVGVGAAIGIYHLIT